MAPVPTQSPSQPPSQPSFCNNRVKRRMDAWPGPCCLATLPKLAQSCRSIHTLAWFTLAWFNVHHCWALPGTGTLPDGMAQHGATCTCQLALAAAYYRSVQLSYTVQGRFTWHIRCADEPTPVPWYALQYVRANLTTPAPHNSSPIHRKRCVAALATPNWLASQALTTVARPC